MSPLYMQVFTVNWTDPKHTLLYTKSLLNLLPIKYITRHSIILHCAYDDNTPRVISSQEWNSAMRFLQIKATSFLTRLSTFSNQPHVSKYSKIQANGKLCSLLYSSSETRGFAKRDHSCDHQEELIPFQLTLGWEIIANWKSFDLQTAPKGMVLQEVSWRHGRLIS